MLVRVLLALCVLPDLALLLANVQYSDTMLGIILANWKIEDSLNVLSIVIESQKWEDLAIKAPDFIKHIPI